MKFPSKSKKTYKSKKSYKAKPKVNLGKLVKKIVSTQLVEKKSINFSANVAVTAYPGTSWATFDIIPMTPYPGYNAIIQNDGQGDRIGNKITTHRCVLKYCLFPNAYNVTTNPQPMPQVVMMYLFKVKGDLNTIPTTLGSFFQNGNSAVAPSGNLIDFTKEVNRDAYTPLAFRKHKIGCSAYTGTGSTVASQYFQNNEFKFNTVTSWDITKYITKNIKYQDTSTFPTSDAVFLMIQTVNADGSNMTASTVPLQLYYDINYTYTDM